MGTQDAFALGQSNLNGFLLADIGIERSGMPLSVLSALARLGLDPWQEAARLAKLPRTAAMDGLARLIAGMPATLWPMADARPIAARLVALLPGREALPDGAGMSRERGGWLLVAVIVGTTLLAGLATFYTNSVARPVGAPPVAAAAVNPVHPPTGQ